MSIIKEINESHERLKGVLLNLFIMPVWYICIYFFCKELYLNSDILLLGCLTLVLSVSSSLILTMFFSKVELSVKSGFFHNTLVSVVILSVWLIFLAFLVYSLGFFFKIYIYFYTFIVIYYIPILVVFFYGLKKGKISKLK